MSEREYVITLKKGVDYDEFWHHMEHHTPHTCACVPERAVDVVNERPHSLRNCHYALTTEEALMLQQDPRVEAVELPLCDSPHIQPVTHATQTGNFDKVTNSLGNNLNWGLARMISAINNYGTSFTGPTTYPYVLDGSGVDFVLQDTGITRLHPEFLDAQGESRVVQLDWYAASGITGTMPTGYYNLDHNGHGTHVAGIAAGKTYGWAKNAAIYVNIPNGLDGLTGGLPLTDIFDMIRLWHRDKPLDPATGLKRPTVVNMSWGVVTTWRSPYQGEFRGQPFINEPDPEFGLFLPQLAYGQIPGSHGIRIASMDADLDQMTDEGIIIVKSAGNYRQKIDVEGGVDWDNYYLEYAGNPLEKFYYHRGGSPVSNGTIIVGNLDHTPYDATLEQKRLNSERGPGVHLWAPGSEIRSAYKSNFFGSAPYYANSQFAQRNLSGTSMSSPQVAGLACLYLQVNPHATPAQVLSWLLSHTTSAMYSPSTVDDWSDYRNLLGGEPRVCYWPWAYDQNLGTQGIIQFSGVSV